MNRRSPPQVLRRHRPHPPAAGWRPTARSRRMAGLPRRARMVGQALRSTPEASGDPLATGGQRAGRGQPPRRPGLGRGLPASPAGRGRGGLQRAAAGSTSTASAGTRTAARVAAGGRAEAEPTGSRRCRSSSTLAGRRSRVLNQCERCCGGAVGPGLGVHPAGGLLLDAVVAHRGGGVERLVDVARAPGCCRCWVGWAQTPARQSACSSRRTESALACVRVRLLRLLAPCR